MTSKKTRGTIKRQLLLWHSVEQPAEIPDKAQDSDETKSGLGNVLKVLKHLHIFNCYSRVQHLQVKDGKKV